MEWSIKTFGALTAFEMYKLIQLRQDVFIIEQQCLYRDCDDKDLVSKHVFAIEQDLCIAYTRLVPPGISYSQCSSIGRVVVHPKYRKLDYGKILMEQSMNALIQDFPKDPIRISAQQYLEKFYQGLGFQTQSEMYLEDDIPHIAMQYDQHLKSI